MNKFLIFLLLTPLCAKSQLNRYFVTFKDKANSSYSITAPQQFLSQKSINRRIKENFLTNEEDLPVSASYVQLVKNTGAKVYFSSRWFNGVLVQTNAAVISLVAGLSCVSKVELVAPGSRLAGRMKANQKFDQTQAANLQNQLQLEMIGLNKMQADGFRGEGIDIAIFDGPFNGVDTLTSFKAIYKENRLKDVFNFVANSSDIYTDHSDVPHGTWVLSIMAGNIPGAYLGGAFKANFFLYQTEDVSSEYRVEEYNWLFAAERADSAGVDVINSSLGYSQFDDASMDYAYSDLDGKTSVISRAARKAFERGMSVVISAGNEGNTSWQYITPPADAKGIIACGGVSSSLARVSFSSIGPTADGRIKPDVSGLALFAPVITSSGDIYGGTGTSFSTPQVTCLVVGLRQAFPDASSAEIYSRVVYSASQSSHPDNLLGYGIPDYEAAKSLTDFTDEFEVYPNPASDLVKIIFKKPTGQNVKATLFTSIGQEVSESSITVTWDNNPYSINVFSLPSAVYFLRIQTDTSIRSQRIIKVN